MPFENMLCLVENMLSVDVKLECYDANDKVINMLEQGLNMQRGFKAKWQTRHVPTAWSVRRVTGHCGDRDSRHLQWRHRRGASRSSDCVSRLMDRQQDLTLLHR